MPTYTFFNKDAGIEYDEVMSMSEYDKYMEDHEICAAPKIIIGHDSTDGRTWANDV